MIGRTDTTRSQSNVAMNSWLPQTSYPCGSFSDISSWTPATSSPIFRQHETLSLPRFGHFPARKMAAGKSAPPSGLKVLLHAREKKRERRGKQKEQEQEPTQAEEGRPRKRESAHARCLGEGGDVRRPEWRGRSTEKEARAGPQKEEGRQNEKEAEKGPQKETVRQATSKVRS